MISEIFFIWLAVFILMTLVWGIYLKIKNPGIIDVFWPISITMTAIYFIRNSEWNYALVALVVLLLMWGIRLSFFLFITRILPNINEARYEAISKKWNMPLSLGFFLHFQFQGILAILIASPFFWLKNLSDFNFFSMFSILLILIGLIGETIADFQLNHFKKYNKGNICNIGLWSYSRHPNYFFEILVWLGFGLSGVLVSPFTLVSPIILFVIMYFITGPITEEQSLRSKGDKFLAYQRATPYFFPWRFKSKD